MGRPPDVRKKMSSNVSATKAFQELSDAGWEVLFADTKLQKPEAIRELSSLAAREPKATQKANWRRIRNHFNQKPVIVSQSGDSFYMYSPKTEKFISVPFSDMVGFGDKSRLHRETGLACFA